MGRHCRKAQDEDSIWTYGRYRRWPCSSGSCRGLRTRLPDHGSLGRQAGDAQGVKTQLELPRDEQILDRMGARVSALLPAAALWYGSPFGKEINDAYSKNNESHIHGMSLALRLRFDCGLRRG